MAKYNVVTLSFGAHSHSFYGRQDDHNHTKNKKFVQAATALMVEQCRCNYNEVRGGLLQINQNHPGNAGNELKWVDRESAWRRV